MKNETGRSMIEMLGVLAIIGVLSVGGIAGYSKAMYKMKMNKTIDIVNRVLVEFSELAMHNLGNGYIDLFSIALCDEDMSNCQTTSNDGIETLISTLKEICKDKNFTNGDGYPACPLPIGDIFISTYFGKVKEAYFGIYFTGEQRVQNCIDFASHNWITSMPQNLLQQGGFLSIYAADGTEILYSPKENKNHYTIAEITDICGTCTDENDQEYCIVEFDFKF